ncbi:MAG: MBL fold metallo-hydrolase [Desulfobacterales bacterium]|jgi:metallo-beta-lactamase family protein
MDVTFYGATREVTGSMHLLRTDSDAVLLDCGLFQGRRKESDTKNRTLPFDPKILTNAVLSHAHIDHSGRIPLLTRNGFTGRVITTRATAHASEYLLLDSAHIQESDANYLNYKTVRAALQDLKAASWKKRKGKKEDEIRKLLKTDGHRLNTEAIGRFLHKFRLEGIEPLYTISDAEQSLTFFDGRPYRSPVTIGKGIQCTFYDAGHILGSAITILRCVDRGRAATIAFSGDIGRFHKPILRNPALSFDEADRQIDLMILESTYGDRLHEPVEDMKPRLGTVIADTVARGGSVVIPSFAFGRTQELLYVIHQLYESGEVPKVPVFVDSPLATKITRVFGEHPEVYDKDTQESFLQWGKNPFFFKQVTFVSEVEASMALMRDTTPHIVISASGMCEAGRILHHLRYKIHNEKNTILIVGFMARNTLGRRILEQGEAYAEAGRKGDPPIVRFFNKEYPLKAHVVKLGGFSAHGDKNEMLRFLRESNLKINKIALVHGEEDQCLAFADTLKAEGFPVVVPRTGETVRV